MKINKLAILLALMTTTAFAQNGPTNLNTIIKDRIEKMIGSGQVESVTKTPYAELYELRTKNGLYYTDKDAKYFFAGNVIEVPSKKNLTEERLSELNKIDFSILPLDKAIKYTKGNGKNVIAVFEDPNCGYCKQFRKNLQTVDNITVYTFQYNILTPESIEKSRKIWCSANPSKAWDDWMISGKAPEEVSKDCVAPHEKVLALGKSIHVNGTPTIIFADGTRTPGMLSDKQLEERLQQVQTVQPAKPVKK